MTTARAIDARLTNDTTFALEGGPSASLLVGIGLALIVEGIALHLWIASRSQPWAWTITALNLATLGWLWRDQRARARATLTLGESDVSVVVGNQLRCRFPQSAVASIDIATWRSVPDMARDYVNTAKPLEPNVLIVFREPVDARLAFGIQKSVRHLGVRVATPERLIAAIASARTPS